MAETFVFDDKIQSTDGTLTLELTRSADLGLEETPKPSVKLELTPSEDSWVRTAPSLELGATSAQAYGAAEKPKVELVTAPTLAEHMARVEAEAAAKEAAARAAAQPAAQPVAQPATYAAPAAAVAAAPAVAAAVAQPAAYTAPAQATYAAPAAASYAAPAYPQYNQYGTQVNAAPATTAYTAANNTQAMTVATYPAQDLQLYMFPEAIYPMTQKDRDYRMWAFILNIVTTCLCAWAVIPLAWMIPTTVHSWKVYKGTQRNTTLFSVLDLIFTNLISGILLLCTENK